MMFYYLLTRAEIQILNREIILKFNSKAGNNPDNGEYGFSFRDVKSYIK